MPHFTGAKPPAQTGAKFCGHELVRHSAGLLPRLNPGLLWGSERLRPCLSHFSADTHALNAGRVGSDLVGLQWGPEILHF